MSDFFREVDEDYRRDRLLQIWARYQWLFIAAAVGIVAATAGWRITQHFQTEAANAAGAQYEAALQLATEGKSAEAEAAFAAIGRAGPKGYATLARLRAVDELAGRDAAAGAAGYAALAADAGYDPAFRDMVKVRGAMLRVDSDDPKQFEEAYAPLAQNFAYRNSIRELLALAAFRRNDFEAAGRWLDMILGDAAAPAALRQRAEALSGLVQAGAPPPAPVATGSPAPAGAVPGQ